MMLSSPNKAAKQAWRKLEAAMRYEVELGRDGTNSYSVEDRKTADYVVHYNPNFEDAKEEAEAFAAWLNAREEATASLAGEMVQS